MKIAVFSDSHGKTDIMEKSVIAEKPDMIIHLGDLTADAQALCRRFADIPVRMVRGNCDMFSTEEDEILLEAEGKRILAMHGHTRHVKAGLQNAVYAALERQADILLFGHTHRPLCDERNGVLLLNPGTAGEGAFKTYGIIDIANGKALCRTVKP